MKYEISDTLYKQIEDLTGVDYNRIGKDIPVENIESIIEDLIYEIHNRDEQIEEIKEDIKDNYRQLTPSQLTGVSEFGNEINF